MIEVDTTVAVAELLERAAHAARVVIRVAAFTDGRFFSQVRALAESREFSGAIEVRGNLLPDRGRSCWRATASARWSLRTAWTSPIGPGSSTTPGASGGWPRHRRG
ncbi:MAG: DUF934 domain-containing protein [Gammaproteobacteria bacterium]|nr:DUF934 domain-containing protein [Gammaproteobacteria bacterium]